MDKFTNFVGVGVDVTQLPQLIEIGHKRMSGPWRVWEVCLTRMNNWGHAAFDTGELATLACGKDTPANRTMVTRWLRTLAEMDRIMPLVQGGSTQLCVVVNAGVVLRNAGKASDYLCAEPGHRGHQKQRWPVKEATTQASERTPEACAHNWVTYPDGQSICRKCGKWITRNAGVARTDKIVRSNRFDLRQCRNIYTYLHRLIDP